MGGGGRAASDTDGGKRWSVKHRRRKTQCVRPPPRSVAKALTVLLLRMQRHQAQTGGDAEGENHEATTLPSAPSSASAPPSPPPPLPNPPAVERPNIVTSTFTLESISFA